MEKINWNKLKEKKAVIRRFKEVNGTQGAINFSEGLLGLKRGELMKNRPRIRKFVRKL